MKKVLFVASISGHITAFHIPFLKLFKENGYEVACKAAKVLAKRSGMFGMIGGQVIDIQSTNKNIDVKRLKEIFLFVL